MPLMVNSGRFAGFGRIGFPGFSKENKFSTKEKRPPREKEKMIFPMAKKESLCYGEKHVCFPMVRKILLPNAKKFLSTCHLDLLIFL